MALSPPASLASSQHFDHATGSGSKPFFQPPKSPPFAAVTPSYASANDYFAYGSRKRHRPDSARSRDGNHASVPWTETPSWAQCPTPSDGLYNSAYTQSSGLVNERYRLAGGFDTPSLESTARLEQLTVDEHEFRRRLRDDDMGNTLRGDCVSFSGPLARERNGVARIPATADGGLQTTWTSFAFGIVGKVFSFGSNVFKGFYAGGGRGYDLDYPLVGSDLLRNGRDQTSTPLPGSWQQEEFLGDFEQDSPMFSQQRPLARPPHKRRQTDRDTWVFVGTPDVEAAPTSPKRKISSNSIPRSNLAVRPSASRASSRKSIAPLPRRTSSYVGPNGSPAQQPLASLAQSSNKRASVALTRSPQGRRSDPGSNAWRSPETERYAKRQAKQDRVTDKAISSMGQRMEDLIRQAQEALGTKYSVEGDADMEDEGFVDDDW